MTTDEKIVMLMRVVDRACRLSGTPPHDPLSLQAEAEQVAALALDVLAKYPADEATRRKLEDRSARLTVRVGELLEWARNHPDWESPME